VEIDDESQFRLNRFEEVLHGTGLLLTKRSMTSEKLRTCIAGNVLGSCKRPINSVVPVQVDTSLCWVTCHLLFRALAQVLPLLDNEVVSALLCVIFFYLGQSVHIDDRDEEILVLAYHFNDIGILMNDTTLNQSQQSEERHLDRNELARVVGACD